jgi:signal transduction histidine kinase
MVGMLALAVGMILLVRSYTLGQRFIDSADSGFWRVLLALMVLLPAPAFLSIGALIAIRRNGNSIGTLCSVLGLALAVFFFLDNAFWVDPGSPFGVWAVLLSRTLVQSVFGLIPLLILLFPTGRPPSRGWWAVGIIAGLAVLWALFFGLLQTTLWIDGYGSVMSPLADQIYGLNVAPHDDWALQLAEPASLVLLLMILASVGSLLARWRSADRIQRQQIKWLAAAVILGLTVMISTGLVFGWEGLMLGLVTLMLGVPAAIAIAILRHGLYDIDVVFSRSLVYAAMSVFVVGAYVLVVGGASALLGAGTSGDFAVSILATGLIAAGFQPLRQAVQRAVNRRLYGRRDEPMAVVAALGDRLQAGDSDAALLASIAETVTGALRLPYAEIATLGGVERKASSGRLPAASGLEVFPLSYQGEALGELRVAPSAGERLSTAERALLSTLARQASLAAHAAQTRAALQQSRENIVGAREEERRRLRRDLHDGLGPTLASLAQRLDAAGALTQTDPAAASRMLAEARIKMTSAIADLRQAAYSLRPPSLDELGLVSAVREDAQRLIPPGGLCFEVRADRALPPLPAAVEAAAYRIAMEAITNVIRHAQANRCDVSFAVRTGALWVEIEDDGRGISEDAPSGVGTLSMRERAEELGGRVTTTRREPHGTRVRAILPMSLGGGP